VRSVRPGKGDVETVLGEGEMLKLQDRLIPIYRLHKLFNIDRAEEDLTRGLIVVVEDDGRRAGIFADELLGQQQTVIKNLGESLRELPGLSGGAIMPDGSVGLILDVSGLVRLAHSVTNAGAATEAQACLATA
ncbi:MAG: chemotaxis protein CheW, partial [Planctomycetota bacterium]|nr:chemotaxis protein CheW [Planctomycetota bacterium]